MSRGDISDIARSIYFGDHELRSGVPNNRCAREHETLFLVHTRRTTHVRVLSALHQCTLLDRRLNLLGIEDRDGSDCSRGSACADPETCCNCSDCEERAAKPPVVG